MNSSIALLQENLSIYIKQVHKGENFEHYKKLAKKVIGKLFSFSYVLMFHHVTEEPKTEKVYVNWIKKIKEFILALRYIIGHCSKKSKKKLLALIWKFWQKQ